MHRIYMPYVSVCTKIKRFERNLFQPENLYDKIKSSQTKSSKIWFGKLTVKNLFPKYLQRGSVLQTEDGEDNSVIYLLSSIL